MYKKSIKLYTDTLETLLKECNKTEFNIITKMFCIIEQKTNYLKPLNNKTTQQELSKIFNIDRRTSKLLIDRLYDLGVFGKLDNIKYWILNPYIAHDESFIFTDEIINLFKDTIFYKNTIINIPSENIMKVPEDHNMYILKQPLGDITIYKIGKSKNINKRITDYLNHNPAISLHKTFKVDNPDEYEKEYHKNNKAIYRKEWYLNVDNI